MLSVANIEVIRRRHGAPVNVLVETGTYFGASAERALTQFKTVHTIELDPRIHAAVANRLEALGAKCYLGSSEEIVARLAAEIKEPVFWFLDAHWFDVNEWGGKYTKLSPSSLPLWKELEAIAARDYLDVIVVDDANDFGTRHPTPEWELISPKRVAGYFEAPYETEVFDNLDVIYRR